MMHSEIKTYRYSEHEIQRVQVVKADSFDELDFLRPDFDKRSFEKLCTLYSDFIIPKYSWVFGILVHFYLPEKIDLPLYDEKKYGKIYDKTILCNILFHEHASLKNDEIIFDDEDVKRLFETLKEKGCLHISRGKRKKLSFLPVGKNFGFLSENKADAKMKVNSSFFVMDLFDLGSVYDQVSTPIGLCVKDGKILNPPLFDREVLMVKNNEVSIDRVSLKEIGVIIDGIRYKDGQNAIFYSRPEYRKSEKGGFDIVVVGNKVVACKIGGNCDVPSSGFLIHLNEKKEIRDTSVSYDGMEDLSFAIQVGNSVMKNGEMTEKFESSFYNFLHFWNVSYPPSMYPLNYEKDRAPRIVLGADQENKPMILWFEGEAKFGYDPETCSCGASLQEAAKIASDLGMYNGIHLDGGGSAQILIDGERQLMISDRDKDSFKENERAIPMALYIP